MTRLAKFSRIPARAIDMDLTATDWAVLHVISLHADKAGHAFPSLAVIGKFARISQRTHVVRATKHLEQLGLIRCDRIQQGDGWANNRYQILYAAGEVLPLSDTPPAGEVLPLSDTPPAGEVLPLSDTPQTRGCVQPREHRVYPTQAVASDGQLTIRVLPGSSGSKSGKEESLGKH
jgi:hypothetical protein